MIAGGIQEAQQAARRERYLTRQTSLFADTPGLENPAARRAAAFTLADFDELGRRGYGDTYAGLDEPGLAALIEASQLRISGEPVEIGRRELVTAALLRDTARLPVDQVAFVMNALAASGMTEGVLERSGDRFRFSATQVQGEGWTDIDGLQHVPDVLVEGRRLGTAYRLGLLPDKAGIGAGALTRRIVETIDDHPEIGYALTAIDILSGPVTFAVGQVIEASPIGAFAQDRIGEVRDYFADRFGAVQYDPMQAQDGGTGTVTLGILGLGLGASRTLRLIGHGLPNIEKGALGEAAATRTMTRAGYTQFPSRLPSNQGFDGVFARFGPDGQPTSIVITESKYSTSGRPSLGNTVSMGRQMSGQWVDANRDRMLASPDPQIEATGQMILDADAAIVSRRINVLTPDGRNRWNVLRPPATPLPGEE